MRLEAKDKRIETGDEQGRLKVYLLPNLLTAGNLFCGFLALTKIVEANVGSPDFNSVIRVAIGLILLACIFDLLDGRVARMGGAESPFGREFDSLADIVSFGVAPAFLVHRIVLKDVFVNHPGFGWFIASIYLICGAFRLARFNCLANLSSGRGSSDFLGFPIPAAAGMVASLTLFMLWWEDRNFGVGNWRYALPVIMILLSIMMVSEVRYPSFKKIDMKATRPFIKMVVVTLIVCLAVVSYDLVLPIVLPIFFTSYLVYGFIRPHISRRMRQEIADDDDEHDLHSSGSDTVSK